MPQATRKPAGATKPAAHMMQDMRRKAEKEAGSHWRVLARGGWPAHFTSHWYLGRQRLMVARQTRKGFLGADRDIFKKLHAPGFFPVPTRPGPRILPVLKQRTWELIWSRDQLWLQCPTGCTRAWSASPCGVGLGSNLALAQFTVLPRDDACPSRLHTGKGRGEFGRGGRAT
jgi:hypothetical protein